MLDDIKEILIQNKYLYSVLIVVGAYFFAQIFTFFLRRYVKMVTQKTKSEIDDVLLKTATKPLSLLITIFGLYFALKILSIPAPYDKWVDGIFFVIAIFVAASLVSKIITILTSSWLKVQKKYQETPKLVNKIVIIAVYLIAALMVLGFFGIEITPLLATLGLGGLAIGLALQDTLSNLFAGLHIVSDKPIKVGDYVELEENIEGYVEDIGWRSTKIRTLPNNIIIIPNSKLAESTIINNSLPKQEMAALVQCGVAYDSDLKKVEEATLDVAKKVQKTVPGAIKDFEPFIRYHTFGDSNIDFTVILRVEEFVAKYLIKHEFIKALKERYDKEGIEISWPVRKIYHGDKK